MATNKTRVTLDLPPREYEMLGRLVETTESESKTQTLKKAIRLLDYVAKKRKDTYEFVLRRQGEPDRLIEFLELSP